MKPGLLAADELPEIASDVAVNAALQDDLAELFATLSAVEVTDEDGVAAGRARLLAAVTQSTERYAPLFGKLTEFFDLTVDALRAVFARAELESEWTPGPLPWVSLFHLDGGPKVAGLDTGFVRLKKGMPFPRHRHVGPERVMILSGGYHDDDQRWYGPGDLHVMDVGTEHSLQMTAEEDVLLAVILAADIEVVGT